MIATSELGSRSAAAVDDSFVGTTAMSPAAISPPSSSPSSLPGRLTTCLFYFHAMDSVASSSSSPLLPPSFPPAPRCRAILAEAASFSSLAQACHACWCSSAIFVTLRGTSTATRTPTRLHIILGTSLILYPLRSCNNHYHFQDVSKKISYTIEGRPRLVTTEPTY